MATSPTAPDKDTGLPVASQLDVPRPLIVEVMGPAAAGKTSVVRALSASDPRITPGIPVPRWRWFPHLIGRLVPLIPVWMTRYPGDRWFTWNEMKSVAFLNAWLGSIDRSGHGPRITVLDHGPVYRLARLREFGPTIARSERFERWRRALLDTWLNLIDLVVVLDAPDEVLLRRVDARGHWWLSADRTQEEKRDFYTRYREAFEEALATPVEDPPRVLRVRSDEADPERIADRILATLESPLLTSVGKEPDR